MKAGVLDRIEHLVVKEVPEPQLENRSMMVKVKVCRIYGTDPRIYRYGDPRVRLPRTPEDETAGEVKAVDDAVANFAVGDRVAITPRIACGDCLYCCKGQHICCQNSRTFGHQLPGGYAEYWLVPSRGVEFGVLNRVFPMFQSSPSDPFLQQVQGSGRKWALIANTSGMANYTLICGVKLQNPNVGAH